MRHLLPDQDAPAADVVAERLGEAEQRARDAPLDREEARGGERAVGVPQAARQQDHQVLEHVGVRPAERLEHSAADETQFRITQRRDRGRARRPVDHRQFADDGTGPQDRKDALGAGRRDHADLEQAILDPIAAVARVAGEEHHLIGPHRLYARFGEQAARQLRAGARRTGCPVGAPVLPSYSPL